jgi:hypothetical protein
MHKEIRDDMPSYRKSEQAVHIVTTAHTGLTTGSPFTS